MSPRSMPSLPTLTTHNIGATAQQKCACWPIAPTISKPAELCSSWPATTRSWPNAQPNGAPIDRNRHQNVNDRIGAKRSLESSAGASLPRGPSKRLRLKVEHARLVDGAEKAARRASAAGIAMKATPSG